MINCNKQRVDNMEKELMNAKNDGSQLNIAAKIADRGLSYVAKINGAKAQLTHRLAIMYRDLEKNLELSKLELSGLRLSYEKSMDLYSKIVAGEITEDAFGNRHDTMRQCANMASQIEEKESDMIIRLHTYLQEYHNIVNEVTKQVRADIRELEACVNQIRVDQQKYGKYIICIRNIEILGNEPADCGDYEGLEYLDAITEEDDLYLKSICDDYKGVEYYRGIISRLKAEFESRISSSHLGQSHINEEDTITINENAINHDNSIGSVANRIGLMGTSQIDTEAHGLTEIKANMFI